MQTGSFKRVKICVMLLGNTQLLPVAALLWSRIGRSMLLLLLSAGPYWFNCSHLLILPVLMQQCKALLLTDSWTRVSVCFWKNSSKSVARVSQCLQADSLLVHLCCIWETREGFPLCCRAFFKVLIVTILGILYFLGLWNHAGPLDHLQKHLA